MKQYHRKALLVAITLIINKWELIDSSSEGMYWESKIVWKA